MCHELWLLILDKWVDALPDNKRESALEKRNLNDRMRMVYPVQSRSIMFKKKKR